MVVETLAHRRVSRLRIAWSGGVVVMALALSGCATLPKPGGRIVSTVLADTAGTALGRAVADRSAGGPEGSPSGWTSTRQSPMGSVPRRLPR